jgi:hypothetical protein
MEYYSAVRKIKLLFAGKQIELEIIILSDVSQAKKVKYYTFCFICGT